MDYKKADGSSEPVKLLRTGIAWESDKNYKFKNPDTGDQSLQECKISLLFKSFMFIYKLTT